MTEPMCFEMRDVIGGLRNLPDSSFDRAIADPPYEASTIASWKLDHNHGPLGFGGAWRYASHTWDLFNGFDGFKRTIVWLGELNRLVKPAGSLWIHATYHNEGVWFKGNVFPNLLARRLTASHETVIWAYTGGGRHEYHFGYETARATAFAEDR